MTRLQKPMVNCLCWALHWRPRPLGRRRIFQASMLRNRRAPPSKDAEVCRHALIATIGSFTQLRSDTPRHLSVHAVEAHEKIGFGGGAGPVCKPSDLAAPIGLLKRLGPIVRYQMRLLVLSLRRAAKRRGTRSLWQFLPSRRGNHGLVQLLRHDPRHSCPLLAACRAAGEPGLPYAAENLAIHAAVMAPWQLGKYVASHLGRLSRWLAEHWHLTVKG